MTFAPNLSTVTACDGSMSGYIALGVTAWSKNPFLGMVAGVLVRYLGRLHRLGHLRRKSNAEQRGPKLIGVYLRARSVPA